jgi:hypothetical protein
VTHTTAIRDCQQSYFGKRRDLSCGTQHPNRIVDATWLNHATALRGRACRRPSQKSFALAAIENRPPASQTLLGTSTDPVTYITDFALILVIEF